MFTLVVNVLIEGEVLTTRSKKLLHTLSAHIQNDLVLWHVFLFGGYGDKINPLQSDKCSSSDRLSRTRSRQPSSPSSHFRLISLKGV